MSSTTSIKHSHKHFSDFGFRRSINKICVLLGCYERRWVVIYRRFGTTYRPHLQR